jgi:uncharacterized protein YbjT (DUF2867 family)
MHTAYVFGGTGLTGSWLIEELIASTEFSKVVSYVRGTPTIYQQPKIEEIQINFDNITELPFNEGFVFNCLGTTLKKAGTKVLQQKIDRDYPIAIAKQAALSRIKKMISISSVGADITSTNFYLRTKGEMEAGILQHMKEKAIFLRPSLLLGQRKEQRVAEKIGTIVSQYLVNHLLVGKLAAYKSIDARLVAKAMVKACLHDTPAYLHYTDIQLLLK